MSLIIKYTNKLFKYNIKNHRNIYLNYIKGRCFKKGHKKSKSHSVSYHKKKILQKFLLLNFFIVISSCIRLSIFCPAYIIKDKYYF